MIQPENIHPLADFHRRPGVHMKRLKHSGLPEVLTVKGRAELIVQTAEAYQAMLTKLDLYESAICLSRGLQDAASGNLCSLADFDRRMKTKYSVLGESG